MAHFQIKAEFGSSGYGICQRSRFQAQYSGFERQKINIEETGNGPYLKKFSTYHYLCCLWKESVIDTVEKAVRIDAENC